MITANEILSDLDKIKKKVEFARVTYPNNSLYSLVDEKIGGIIDIIKIDMRIFRYGKK